MLPSFLLVPFDGRSPFRSDVLLTFWFAGSESSLLEPILIVLVGG